MIFIRGWIIEVIGYYLKGIVLVNYLLIILCLILIACSKDDVATVPANMEPALVSAVDISNFPEISTSSPTFYNLDSQKEDFLNILKANGVNTIRLRLWVNPENGHSGLEEVKNFAASLKSNGFRIWLTVHYSDTWADPGNQIIPETWQNLGFTTLKDSVRQYTAKVVGQIKPEFIQIGNEINSGLLHPYGEIGANSEQMKTLLTSATQAVRANSSDTKIIIHYAGLEGSDWFFSQLDDLDYDIIGLSYYPLWHGKQLDMLKTTLNQLSESYKKDMLIAETAYPFTLDWNDYTNNIVGLDEQLILPEFAATPEGQRKFVKRIREIIVNEVNNGIGFCYWGAELVAWKGNQATDGSVWENQALFDFEYKALPVLEEFRQ